MKKTAGVLGVVVVWLGVMPGSSARAQELERSSQAQVLKQAALLYSRADERVVAGDFEGALRYFEQALPLYRKAGDGAGEAMALLRSGLMRQQLEDCQEALPILQQALPLVRTISRPEWEGRALLSLGNCHLQAGNSREALEHLQRALPFMEAREPRLSHALTLSMVGVLLEEQGRSPQALEALKRASALFHAEGQTFQEAVCARMIGLIHERASEHAPARESYQRALTLFQSLGERSAQAQVNESLGTIARAQGRFQEALVHYQRALSLYEELHDPGATAQLELLLGGFYDTMGNHSLALQYFQRAHDSWRTLGQQPPVTVEEPRRLEDMSGVMALMDRKLRQESHQQMQAMALRMVGLEQQHLERWPEARASYERALTLLREAKDTAGEATLQMEFASLHEAQGELLEAVRCYARAQELFRSLGDKTQEALCVAEGARLLPGLNVPGEATKALAYVEKLLEQVRRPEMRAIILGLMAITHERLEDAAGAMRCYQRRLEVYEQLGEPEHAADVLVSIGLNHEVRGVEASALAAYEKALALIEPVRALAGAEEMKTRIASEFWLAYEQAIQLHLRRGNVAKAFVLSERGRARAFLDVLGNARPAGTAEARDGLILKDQTLARELALLDQRIARGQATGSEDAVTALKQRRAALRTEADDLLIRLRATHPRYASLQSVETLGVPEVQRLLDARTTLVSYVNLEKVVAFVITRKSLHAVELPLTSEELRELVPGARGLVASAQQDVLPQKALEALHARLVAPLTTYLKTPRVGFIPHGVLHYLPFAALSDGKQYLGDKYTLFSLPSASALRYLPKRRMGKGPVLAMSQGQAEGFPALDSADAEALAIARLHGGKALTGAAATEAALKQGASKASVLHVAAHGELDHDSPLFSRIVLAPGGGEDGSLTVGEVYGMDLSASQLVVLSACQTSVGAHSQGDDVVGLTRAFLYAQAPAVVSSLWTVDDEATRVLMTEFHAQLKKGRARAEALREAQARTRVRFPHPYHWAAFVLTGDPG